MLKINSHIKNKNIGNRPGRRFRGQSTVEFAVLIIIVLGAFIASQNYFKRAIQGQWKEAVDGLGDQYDPRAANSYIKYTLTSSAVTDIVAVPVNGGIYTTRTDTTNSVERKQGSIAVGAY